MYIRCEVKPGKVIAEMILFQRTKPLPSPLSLEGVTDTYKIFHAAGDDGEALRQRRGLSVTEVQQFTEEYKPGFSPLPTGVDSKSSTPFELKSRIHF